jgi:hypothetical protein
MPARQCAAVAEPCAHGMGCQCRNHAGSVRRLSCYVLAMLADLLVPGRLVLLRLADGTPVAGRVRAVADGWLSLGDLDGEQAINLAHVASVRGQDSTPEATAERDEGGLMRPRSKEAPVKVGARAVGRPWTEPELKGLADAFLDGHQDGELAARFNRTRSQVTELHRAFECARGNLVEDQISPAAQTWVPRWRRVLAG